MWQSTVPKNVYSKEGISFWWPDHRLQKNILNLQKEVMFHCNSRCGTSNPHFSSKHLTGYENHDIQLDIRMGPIPLFYPGECYSNMYCYFSWKHFGCYLLLNYRSKVVGHHQMLVVKVVSPRSFECPRWVRGWWDGRMVWYISQMCFFRTVEMSGFVHRVFLFMCFFRLLFCVAACWRQFLWDSQQR